MLCGLCPAVLLLVTFVSALLSLQLFHFPEMIRGLKGSTLGTSGVPVLHCLGWSLACGRTIPTGGDRPRHSTWAGIPRLWVSVPAPHLPSPVPNQLWPCPVSHGWCSVCCPVCHCLALLLDPCQEAQNQMIFQDPFQAKPSCDPALALLWAGRIFKEPS